MREMEPEHYYTIGILFLLLMRWSHRNWGKAVLSTLFAPLIAIPLFCVTFMGVSMVLRLVSRFLSGFGGELSVDTMTALAYSISGVIFLWFLILYCRDQRHLSQIETGPGLGVRTQDPKPSLNAKTSLK